MGELGFAVDALAAVDPDLLDPAELGGLLVELAAQRDRLTAVGARLTAAHGRRMAWKAEGALSQKEWLVDRCRLDPGVAGRQSREARHLAELPRTAEAFAQGAITPSENPTDAGACRAADTTRRDGACNENGAVVAASLSVLGPRAPRAAS